MTKQAGGLRQRRRPDVMELLARARPASLDPGEEDGWPAAQIAARIAAAAGTAEGPPAAEPRRARPGPRPGRAAGRLPRAAVLTGTGVTVTAAAAAVAVLVASAGTGNVPRRHGAAPVMLTAAMVHRVASASRSALALSGQALITYRNTQNAAPSGTGSDTITFSGKNWNDVISQSVPAADGQSVTRLIAINRIVGRQFYLYAAGRTPKLQWYRDTNPTGHPSFTIPDPRTVLRVLEPSAGFVVAGYQGSGPARLKELRATSLTHLPGLGSLPDVGPGSHLTSLEVWVDGHGVVHRMSLALRYVMTAYSLARLPGVKGQRVLLAPDRAAAAKLRASLKHKQVKIYGARIIVRVAPHRPGSVHREVQVTALTVTFSHIGQPQRITAPAHAIPVFGQG
jgi:hypothetical protein